MFWGELAAAGFGLVIGSFLNVCIYRVPRGLSVISPRSRCPHCSAPLRPWENIPLLSYLLQRGRCRRCSGGIAWFYPAVEAMTGLTFVLLFRKFGWTPALGVNMLFFSLLTALIFIDLFERILPDPLTLGGTIAGFLLAPLQSPEILGAPTPLSSYLEAALGAALGGGTLWLVATAYLKLKKIEGMGFGDIKMMLMVGVFVGWRFAWLTIFVGSLLGAVSGALFILAYRKGRRYELPFGTFLGLGAMIVVLWGQDLIRWYLG